MQERKKSVRRGAARPKNLPADANSLEQQFVSLVHAMQRVANQLKRNPHDYKTRRRMQILHDQRTGAFEKLRKLDSERAAKLTRDQTLVYSRPEEVANENFH